MANRVNFSDFRAKAADNYGALTLAAEYLRKNPGSTLYIEPGVYEITEPLARKIMNECMEGQYGRNPQPTMFNPNFEYSRGLDFDGVENATVEAYGVTFLMDGYMEIVSIRNCSNVTVKGLTIDYKRKPYSVGEVIECDTEYMTLKFPDEYPIHENIPCPRTTFVRKAQNVFEFMAVKEKPRVTININSMELVAPQTLRVKVKKGGGPEFVGLHLAIVHTFHFRPAIFIADAKNTVIKDVTVHCHSGMGILGHRAENILLSGFRVIPSLGEVHSTNTDATHFVSCKGTIRFEYCTFEGHGDDGTNVHTYYHTARAVNGNRCEIFTEAPDGTHPQSLDYPDVGDILELVENKSLDFVRTYKVLEVIPHFDELYSEIVVDGELPTDTENYFLSDVSQVPRLEVVYCSFRNHLARSILCKNRGVLIENNNFLQVDGMAVEVAPERSWREGISGSDIVIRRNRMVYCRWGGVEIKVDTKEPNGTSIKNILIEDNLIDCPHSPKGIMVRDSENVTIRRNKVISGGEDYLISNCKNLDLSE